MFGTVRIALSCFLLWLPFLMFATLSADSNNALILIFPFFGTIPALIMALLVFSRIENVCAQSERRYFKYLFVPLAGVLSVFIFKFVGYAPYLLVSGPEKENVPAASWDGMGDWFAGSFAWGIIWLVTGDVLKWLGVRTD